MPRSLSLLTVVCPFLFACSGKAPTSGPAGEGRAQAKLELQDLRKDSRVSLRALKMQHQILGARLGAHRVSCTSTLLTKLSQQPTHRLEQEVVLRMDDKGHFSALKTTDPQYGNEVIWTGDWLYPRMRYGKFIQRKARPEEPAAIANRMVGLLPAYVDLLGRFLTIIVEGKETIAGRETARLSLGLKEKPSAEEEWLPPAKRWRGSISATRLQGKAWIDLRTGAPLRVELSAQWNFNPPAGATPPSTGIPPEIDGARVGTMELSFSQRVTDIGRLVSIAPPPAEETIENPRRIRLENERQMLTGELPLPDPTH